MNEFFCIELQCEKIVLISQFLVLQLFFLASAISSFFLFPEFQFLAVTVNLSECCRKIGYVGILGLPGAA